VILADAVHPSPSHIPYIWAVRNYPFIFNSSIKKYFLVVGRGRLGGNAYIGSGSEI
jgi:hypothetical protein